MRYTSILTTSVPPTMVKEADRWSKKTQMTRSELVRAALRRYFEELDFEEAVQVANEERRSGKMKVLPRGGLADLIG